MALDPAQVQNLLDYDPESGVLTWRPRVVGSGKLARTDATWNARYAGKPTGYKDKRYGYLMVNIGGRPMAAHRLAWAIVHGVWPRKQIDHINLVRSDNRLCNLREAECAQNAANRPVRSDSLSGLKGVQRHAQTGKWRARIKVSGKSISLGLHDSPEAAANAYLHAARCYFGEFAYGEAA